jgi:hypothetical protein
MSYLRPLDPKTIGMVTDPYSFLNDKSTKIEPTPIDAFDQTTKNPQEPIDRMDTNENYTPDPPSLYDMKRMNHIPFPIQEPNDVV